MSSLDSLSIESTLQPRVMPCLLLADGALVKTIRFKSPQYIGDPVNTINIFNRLEADEVVLLDILATPNNREPDFALIEEVASECTAPLAYGGGIRTLEHAKRIFKIGVEKIVVNTQAAVEPGFIRQLADSFGSQAIIGSVDAKKGMWGGYRVHVAGGRTALKVDPVAHARALAAAGAGEILLTSIDCDGVMKGYDLDLVRSVSEAVDVPLIACGGAGKRADLPLPIKFAGASAVAAGSLFVYQGPERGVLINFPSRPQLDQLLS
jgi:cyclase